MTDTCDIPSFSQSSSQVIRVSNPGIAGRKNLHSDTVIRESRKSEDLVELIEYLAPCYDLYKASGG